MPTCAQPRVETEYHSETASFGPSQWLMAGNAAGYLSNMLQLALETISQDPSLWNELTVNCNALFGPSFNAGSSNPWFTPKLPTLDHFGTSSLKTFSHFTSVFFSVFGIGLLGAAPKKIVLSKVRP